MKAFFVVFALVLALTEALPHHNARHIEDETEDPLKPGQRDTLVMPIDDVPEAEGQELDAQIRHHIYMPLPLAYRESQQPPVIKYVPVYANSDPRLVNFNNPDPRLVNFNVGGGASLGNLASAGFQSGLTDQGFNAGAGANLGLASGGFQTGLTDQKDGFFGTGLHFAGGLGLGPNHSNYYNQGATYLKPGPGATTSGYTYVPASRTATPIFRAPVAPLVRAPNVPLYPTYLPDRKFARTIMYPYYV